MTKLYGTKTCTTNLKEYPPETIAEMPANEGYINEAHKVQILTCHRSASPCPDTRETPPILIPPNIPATPQPHYYEKTKISIENLPIELRDKEVKTFLSQITTLFGKTYYPGTKHQNKNYTTGTRVYQYINLKEHIPKHIYHFGRYLRICHDDQPKDNPTTNTNTNNPEDTPEPPELP